MCISRWLLSASPVLALLLAMACSREVVREVVITPVPGPTATVVPSATDAGETATTDTSVEAKVYRIGIAEDLATTNY